MSGIHQFVPMLHRGDAVGRHTMQLRDVFVARGIDSRIYVELIDPATAGETELASAYVEQCQPGDVLIYQFATASQLAGWLTERPETLVVNYHNVTPPELFSAWDNPLARHQLRAGQELQLMAARTTLAIAVSAHNEAELRQAGFRATSVIPPAAMLASGAHRKREAMEGSRWLMVGRMAPNKSIQHALMALAVTKRHYQESASLEIVGQSVVPAYTAALHHFTAELGLADSVTFRGHVSDEVLAESMDGSDVLVIASEHEGFGVPIIEALERGLPVVANRVGALPEVLGDAGVLVDASDPYATAAAIAGLLSSAAQQAQLAEAATRQLAALDLATAADRFADQVCGLR